MKAIVFDTVARHACPPKLPGRRRGRGAFAAHHAALQL